MVAEIFETIGTVITNFAQILGNGFNSLVTIFYANDSLTTVGVLCLIGLGIGIVYWAFRMVMGLFRVRV